MKDGYGRIIDRLRVSITDRCNLRCVYCMPLHGIPFVPHREILSYEEITEAVRFLHENAGLRRVRITGGEPLLRPDVPRFVEMLGRIGLDDIALTTNAQLLARHADALRDAGLARVNISIDSLRPERFHRLGRAGDLERTLAGIDAARSAGLAPVKLNMVVMRGWNDDEIVDLVRYSAERGIEIRFLELMAIGEAGPFHEKRFVSMDECLERIGASFDLAEAPLELGSTSVTYDVSDGNGLSGIIGFIAPVSRPFCGHCRRLRLSATGRFRGCLTSTEGIDIRSILRGPEAGREEELCRALDRAIVQKPWLSGMANDTTMHALGG